MAIIAQKALRQLADGLARAVGADASPTITELGVGTARVELRWQSGLGAEARMNYSEDGWEVHSVDWPWPHNLDSAARGITRKTLVKPIYKEPLTE